MKNELEIGVSLNCEVSLSTEDVVSLWLSIYDNHPHVNGSMNIYTSSSKECKVCRLFDMLTTRLIMDAMIISVKVGDKVSEGKINE